MNRGDIIVFRYPRDIRQTYVKRVIGLPGDHIRVVDKRLVLNGHEPVEPYAVHKSSDFDAYRDNFPNTPGFSVDAAALSMLEHNVQNGMIVVPAGRYFVMGDNRDNSSDSRYWGFVPRENVIGKPLIIYWSYNASTEDLSNPLISADHLIDLAAHFFSKTRWDRSLMLVHGYRLE